MWNIVPGKSAGPFELGHEPGEYFDVLTGAFRIVKRYPYVEDTYSFGSDGVNLAVDSSKKIYQIYIFRPNEVCLGDIQLLNRNIRELAIELNSSKYVFKPVDVGLGSKELGIVLVEVDGFIDGVEVRKTDS